MTEKATFAAGCFWHVELAFRRVPGVISTTVGYTGGTTANPTYEEVSSHMTGHAEAVEVVFNPDRVSYSQLLEVFWSIHDPTTLNRQGPDIGSQYRSAVFYHSEKQRLMAVQSMEMLQKTPRFANKKLVTEIVPAREFYRAEEYHQRYLEKRNLATCGI